MTTTVTGGSPPEVTAPTDARPAQATAGESTPTRGASRRRRDLWLSLLLGVGCLLVYNANRRAITAGDTYPARYLPFALWHSHSLALDSIRTLAAQGQGGSAYWLEERPDGHVLSLYPVTVPVLLAPLYLPAVVYLDHRGWTDVRLDHVARVMEKLSASLVAALSAALLYWVLRRQVSERDALLLTVAYAFGTTTWVIGSQALWQHGMAELLGVGALLLITGASTSLRVIAAGLLCGLLASVRPPDAILAAALGAYGLFWAGRRAALLVIAAALPVGLVLLYNRVLAGDLAGVYGLRGAGVYFWGALPDGVAGQLFSPAKGLFVFSPFLLFLVLAGRHLPGERRERGLALALAAGVSLQVLFYAKADWRCGISWGPRFLTDLLPFLIVLLAPVVSALGGVGRAGFTLAVAAAVAFEAIGAFCYTGASDAPLYAIDRGAGWARAAWDWRNTAFIASLREGLAPADLFREVRGSFDALEVSGHSTDVVTAGEALSATGWALAGHATPWQVATVLDGARTVATQDFFDRADVRAALHESSPAGWRVTLDTHGLSLGQHHLAALVWVSDRGGFRYLAERTFTVRSAAMAGALRLPEAGRVATGEDLDADARTAAARLREHQAPAGFWLTAFTSTERFQAPGYEMNTFVTSLLLDLLGPLEAKGQLGDSLERARRHLRAQIEPSGLVRYHGLPDAPGIGTLGCVITPDTDDTALVWRLAPGSDLRLRSAALEEINRYRTPEGLYRTWLAPQQAYRCIDPGKDPDPADATIQMHLLLLLAEVEPPAARALCEALRRVIDEDRVWVYYRKTPLVPLLRLDELRRAGCELELPEARVRTWVPGQDTWVAVIRGLDAAADRHPSPSASEAPGEREALLRRLARDDFAFVREHPPLLFHNDLSATVRRGYWSEDVGYALWLRLYDEHANPGHRRRLGE